MSVVEREREVVAPEATEVDVLTRAADLLEEFGWAQRGQGVRFNKPGPFCIGTAIQEAASDLGVPSLVPRAHSSIGFAGIQAVDFNDTPGRTKEEVVARLRSAT